MGVFVFVQGFDFVEWLRFYVCVVVKVDDSWLSFI